MIKLLSIHYSNKRICCVSNTPKAVNPYLTIQSFFLKSKQKTKTITNQWKHWAALQIKVFHEVKVYDVLQWRMTLHWKHIVRLLRVYDLNSFDWDSILFISKWHLLSTDNKLSGYTKRRCTKYKLLLTSRDIPA